MSQGLKRDEINFFLAAERSKKKMTIGAAFLLLLFAAGAAQVSSKELFASLHLKP